MKLIQESSKTKIVNNLIVGVLAIYGISQKQFNLSEPSLFHQIVTEVISPVQEGLASSKKNLSSLWDNYLSIVNTSKENTVLKKQISRLESDLTFMEEMRKENLRLKRLLNFSDEKEHTRVLAQVVGWDSANEFKVIRLNKGTRHGIKPMSPVITDHGLVGYVYRATDNYADVLTILDQNNRVDVVVERTRTHGIIEGVLNFKCALKYIMRNEQVEVGDKLITAGVGGIYPKGIKVGMITSIAKENFGMTLSIEVVPSVDFDKLEEVLVLTPVEGVQASVEPTAAPAQVAAPAQEKKI
ncbi:rod shape-determining protein MreC [Peredibacter starrii]|uniref:Cell shape-determining protein MreC n=1 Tax=Peredibacter starrii TaxID=28202 RepID=A0AAX4HP23_9BACT|nr:rod shape-determining protein MreC [Peredibacter starrii]WPU64906.1 rod shape-determining protein MreC [Peredibacter starrii]